MYEHPFVRTTRSPLAVRNGRRDWFRVRNATAETAEITIFDEVGFFGITARDFHDELKAVTAERIDLRINSPGGDVFDAVAIYNMLRDHPATVRSTVVSLAASAASFIALAGDERVINRHAQMMIHDAWGLAIGNAADMRKAGDFLDRQSEVIAGIYAERAGEDVAHWRSLMAEETWFTDQEAVDAGLVTAVTGEPAPQNAFDLSVFRNPPRAVREPDPEPTKPEDAQPEPDWRREAQLAVAAAELEVSGWRR